MDVDFGFIPDNRSGNSTLINRRGIPDYVPFRYANDNIRMYVNPRTLSDPRTAVINFKNSKVYGLGRGGRFRG